MTRRSLHKRFQAIVAAVGTITPLALLNSCLVDVTGFDHPICSVVPSPSLDTVQLAPDVDGMRIKYRQPESSLGDVGDLCGRAVDRATCLDEVGRIPVPPILRGLYFGFSAPPGVVVTRGNVVSAIATTDELIAAFGTIDTAQEAVIVALANDYLVECNRLEAGGVRAVRGGWEVIGTHGTGCETDRVQYLLFVDQAGTIRIRNAAVLRPLVPGCVSGRRPRGLRKRPSDSIDCNPLGAQLALMARLEAASVHSFHRLERELALHGAPIKLRRRALRAAQDEGRHATVMTRLARTHGGRVRSVGKTDMHERSLFAMALENAVEGYVTETWGALLAHYQAVHAEDREIADAMHTIAREESSHAELSHAVDRWLSPRLTQAQQKRLTRAKLAARKRVGASLSEEVPSAVRAALGLPSVATAAALFGALEPVLAESEAVVR